MRISRLLPALLATAALLFAAPLAAQAVNGRVAEPGGAPVAHVLVALLDATGRQRTAVMTDAQGGFAIRAPGAGRYTLRAERVGYPTVVSQQFELGAGQTHTVQLTASATGVRLQEIVVSGEARRCSVRPGVGVETATLWEEARKALNATAFGQDNRLFRYQVVQFQRDLDTRGRVLKENRQNTGALAVHPFASLPPAELSAKGYMQTREDGTYYYGPDVRVLLSDEFLNDHCMRIAESSPAAGDSLIGLAFEPVRGRTLPEIRGVLWLNRATAELRRVDYNYINLPERVQNDLLGGKVEFERMPTGPWIVRRWSIRMPQVQVVEGTRATPRDLASTRTYENVTLAGIREDGGEVASTSTREGAPILAAAQAAAIEGVVWDSTAAAPLAGATVFVSGTQHTATSDAQGRFRIENLGGGTYTVGFTHPGLGPLAGAARPVSVTAQVGKNATVQLGIPGWGAVAQAVCPDSSLRRFRGVVVGTVAAGAGDLGSATVSAAWAATPTAAAPARGSNVRARADASGVYVLCGVPDDRPVVLAAANGPISGPAAQVRLAGGAARQNLSLTDVSGRVSLATSDSASAIRLSGVSATSRALPRDFERRQRSGRGFFMTAEQIAAKNASHTVDLFRGVPGVQVLSGDGGQWIQMSGAVLSLQNNQTQSLHQGSNPTISGGARTGGGGGGLPNPLEATGVASEAGAAGGVSGHSGQAVCQVKYYVDGVSWQPLIEGRLNDELPPSQIAAMEIYRNASETPAEFKTPGSDCGVVVIWMKGSGAR